jgi:hypothetical protein
MKHAMQPHHVIQRLEPGRKILEIPDIEIFDNSLCSFEISSLWFLRPFAFAALFAGSFLLGSFRTHFLTWVYLQLLQPVQERRITNNPAFFADTQIA